jgi:two-component system NtrC family response regulator
MSRLAAYRWPGNIRELRNVVERCALLAGGTILPEHLPAEIAESGGAAAGTAGIDGAGTSRLADHERTLIVQALNDAGWNQSDAARRLGITRDLLRYRMKKYGLKKTAASTERGV